MPNAEFSKEIHKVRMFILSESCNRKRIADHESEERDRLQHLFNHPHNVINYQNYLCEYEARKNLQQRRWNEIKNRVNGYLPTIKDPLIGGPIRSRFLGSWKKPNTNPFINRYPERGLSLHDVQQGNIGDCYLLAAIASILIHPFGMEYIDSMIEPIGEGYIGVRFLQPDIGGVDPKVFYVVIKSTLHSLPKFFNEVDSHAGTISGSWLALIEKAYACFKIALDEDKKRYSNYNSIAGGEESEAFEAILGKGIPETFENYLIDQSLQCRLNEGFNNMRQAVCIAFKENFNCSGVMYYKDHAYAVIGVTAQGVKLFNPWGANAQGSGSELSFSQLRRYGSSISDSSDFELTIDKTRTKELFEFMHKCKDYNIIINEQII